MLLILRLNQVWKYRYWGDVMVEQFTITDSIYDITDDDVKRFKQLVKENEMLVMIDHHSIYGPRDNWRIIFNTWLLFYENERNMVMDYTRSVYYSSNFYCAELVRESADLKNFFSQMKKEEPSIYLISYYVGRELLKWMYNLLATSPEGQQLFRENYFKDYFKLASNPEVRSNYQHPFFKHQKFITNLMSQNYRSSNDFQQHIQIAIKYVKQHLVLLEQLQNIRDKSQLSN